MPRSGKENVHVSMRMDRNTFDRFHQLAKTARLTQGQTLGQLLVRGEAWVSLWQSVVSGEFSVAPELQQEAVGFLKREVDLRIDLHNFVLRMVDTTAITAKEKRRFRELLARGMAGELVATYAKRLGTEGQSKKKKTTRKKKAPRKVKVAR